MNEDQRRSMLLLADGLESVSPEKFRMGIWAEVRYAGPDRLSCEFAGCAIGWATRIIPDCRLRLVGDNHLNQPEFGGKFGILAVAEYFGISVKKVFALFSIYGYGFPNHSSFMAEELGRLASATAKPQISPQRVACKLRCFLSSWGRIDE